MGRSEREIGAGGMSWHVQAYKADCYRSGQLVLVFHGSDRNPRLARDNAIPLADAGCSLIVAPLFDEVRFSRWGYQFGGLGELVKHDGRRKFVLKPRELQTGQLVLNLIEALRAEEARPEMPYSLIGHSAGAQFLGRFAAFFPNEARRIVLANPGSYVIPNWDRKYPYGFGGLTPVNESDRERYLESPIVILVASRDTKRGGLDKSPPAERQGLTRFARGHFAYQIGKTSAVASGVLFGWSLVVVSGLGHGSARLYARPETAAALYGACANGGAPVCPDQVADTSRCQGPSDQTSCTGADASVR